MRHDDIYYAYDVLSLTCQSCQLDERERYHDIRHYASAELLIDVAD